MPESSVEGSRRARPTRQDLRKNVIYSVGQASEVLTHLERALTASGFRDAARIYEQMGQALVGQFLWSRRRNEKEALRRFAALAQTAERIDAMLTPYVRLTRQLRALGDHGADTDDQGRDDGVHRARTRRRKRQL